MDTTQWYAAALAAIASLSIVFYILGISISFLCTYATYHFLKHVFYARVHKYVRGSTRFDALLIIAFLTGNVFCLISDRTRLMQQTGLLSTVNLVPLALGSHMNSVVSCCGLGSEAYNAIHRWIGRVAVIEGVIHVILAVVLQKPNLHASTQVAALVVSLWNPLPG
jgi:hypothetical protein